jgi:hypothetical protein
MNSDEHFRGDVMDDAGSLLYNGTCLTVTELHWKGQNLDLDDLPASIASKYVFQWFRALLRSNELELYKEPNMNCDL